MEHGKFYKCEKLINLIPSVAQQKCTFQVDSSIFTFTKVTSKALITVQNIPEQNRYKNVL